MAIITKLEELMKKRGYSIAKLSEEIGISPVNKKWAYISYQIFYIRFSFQSIRMSATRYTSLSRKRK